ncbi:Tetratricopeptide TPR2 [Penicillium cf. griseofulvum]|uniref:Tetratricopeptide TPR2 n=1 Tax=Penicillium cf. griseofulvum TaxID=2972120 RepID=A0A9W9MQV8_9EURO|nr:Tetratricopeptide TPR2 [Penicillium cf. griseofulvum]KAJ5441199.1 Tetratricopeptide TPR2 [Penicillium cf. griseofulvum]KAJ5449247.1 Tetratricopeptide TPR2 [Penicillium cf. griseofulvum]
MQDQSKHLASVGQTYYDLGSHNRSVTTSSAETQLWFDRGLIWAFSFNHDEAERCFQRAAESDPNCAMALWGVAYAAGPNYNKAWKFFDPEDRRASIEKVNGVLARACKLAIHATPVEQALIEAIGARFPSVNDIPDDLSSFDHAYANAMRPVYQKFSNDMDVAALFAEALMCITPRGLWDLDSGKPTGDHTVEARNIIELGLKQTTGRNHPALCHLYIHLLEMSPFPELALPAADRLRGLVPHASHMLHMPTHIDAAVGDYRRGIDSNHQAMLADDIYFARETGTIMYTVYRVHYICAKLYSALMSGRFSDAMSAAEKIEEVIYPQVLAIKSPPIADFIESFVGSKAHVLVRFGRWEQVLSLELPMDSDTYCVTTAIIYYTRGLAFSALGRIAEAENAQRDFETARKAVPSSRLNSIPCKEEDVLGVASAMLAGELEYRKGNIEQGFSFLREAIVREDGLAYADPPSWMQPVRHALGGLLLEQNRVEEAEVLFKQDLGFAPDYPRRRAKLNNVWGLHGLYECFIRLGKTTEAAFIKPAHDIALASADIPVNVSCFCRTSAVEKDGCC